MQGQPINVYMVIVYCQGNQSATTVTKISKISNTRVVFTLSLELPDFSGDTLKTYHFRGKKNICQTQKNL